MLSSKCVEQKTAAHFTKISFILHRVTSHRCYTQLRKYFFIAFITPREAREWWPLLNVETEQMGTYKWKGSFLVWFVGLVVSVQAILSYLGCSSVVSPVQSNFFSSPHTFSLFVSLWSPLPSSLGRQFCRVACLLIRMITPSQFQSRDIKYFWCTLAVHINKNISEWLESEYESSLECKNKWKCF